jgi:putative acetyltransferase
MEIRRYERSDLEKITMIFQNTVHKVNIKDYTQEQVDAWAPDFIDKEKWNKTLSEHYTFVAVKDNVIIGFGDIDDSGYLDRLYVHHDYLRQGVATLICSKLESMIDSDLTIITHASITAKPFFEKRGYKVVKEQLVKRKGVFLKNYIMELPGPGKASL